MFQGGIFVIMGKNSTTGFDKNRLCFISLKLYYIRDSTILILPSVVPFRLHPVFEYNPA